MSGSATWHFNAKEWSSVKLHDLKFIAGWAKKIARKEELLDSFLESLVKIRDEVEDKQQPQQQNFAFIAVRTKPFDSEADVWAKPNRTKIKGFAIVKIGREPELVAFLTLGDSPKEPLMSQVQKRFISQSSREKKREGKYASSSVVVSELPYGEQVSQWVGLKEWARVSLSPIDTDFLLSSMHVRNGDKLPPMTFTKTFRGDDEQQTLGLAVTVQGRDTVHVVSEHIPSVEAERVLDVLLGASPLVVATLPELVDSTPVNKGRYLLTHYTPRVLRDPLVKSEIALQVMTWVQANAAKSGTNKTGNDSAFQTSLQSAFSSESMSFVIVSSGKNPFNDSYRGDQSSWALIKSLEEQRESVVAIAVVDSLTDSVQAVAPSTAADQSHSVTVWKDLIQDGIRSATEKSVPHTLHPIRGTRCVGSRSTCDMHTLLTVKQ